MHDKPISSSNEDFFEVKKRIISKVIDFVQGNRIPPLTIAITGEWGIGKTSAVDLLCEELEKNKKNVIIKFEPILEGKLETKEIIQLFYLKLYQKLNSPMFRKKIKKLIKSIMMMARFKSSMSLPLGVQIDYDAEKNIDDLLKLSEASSPKTFSEQTKELNKILKKKEIKLYIIVDEIDRLPAAYILQLLLFFRVLETFDTLISIVAFDYKQVLNKLIQEGHLGLRDYEAAKSYLDKFFQIKFNIYHPTEKKVEYVRNILSQDETFHDIIKSDDFTTQKDLESAVEYLSSLRQIKKWLIAIQINKVLIKYTKDQLSFMAFLAATIKHPILIDNLSKYGMQILCVKYWWWQLVVSEQFGIDTSSMNDKDEYNKMRSIFIVSSTGIKCSSENREFVKEVDVFLKKITTQPIEDILSEKLCTKFLCECPAYIILLLIQGYTDERKASAHHDFFGEKIDSTLNILAQDDGGADVLALDLSESLRQISISPDSKPSFKFVNDLWLKKGSVNKFENPYRKIVISALGNVDIQAIIDNTDLHLSERYIERILSFFNIQNENGYDIGKFRKFSIKSRNLIPNNSLDGKNLDQLDADSIRKILLKWVEKFEKEVSNGSSAVFKENSFLSILYRYIQWSKALDRDDKRGKLAISLKNYLDQPSSDKKFILENIAYQCKTSINPIEELFNHNAELISCFKELLIQYPDIKNKDALESCL